MGAAILMAGAIAEVAFWLLSFIGAMKNKLKNEINTFDASSYYSGTSQQW